MAPYSDSPSGVLERTAPATAPQEHHVTKPSTKALERQELLDAFAPSQLRWGNLSWVVMTFIIGMHVAALAAPFFFTWSGLVVALLLHWATCSIGVCLAYHRCLSHKSLKLRNPAKFIATYFGVISG
ncbi:MAG: acyl-CoA desaturase, partial [Planctomycetaceae bacterium]|nr:acyl-CoA desaturase [Planctomycetaceae bacterium]